jgi:DNA-binding transcriptional regulator YiaG
MPNIASVLKDEIVRLCPKELKKEAYPIRKITAAHRRDLAEIKRQLVAAHKRIQTLERAAAKTAPIRPAAPSGKLIRFVAKGLRSMRQRLGLSAADLAALVGVSEQSVYNWDTGPRVGMVA